MVRNRLRAITGVQDFIPEHIFVAKCSPEKMKIGVRDAKRHADAFFQMSDAEDILPSLKPSDQITAMADDIMGRYGDEYNTLEHMKQDPKYNALEKELFEFEKHQKGTHSSGASFWCCSTGVCQFLKQFSQGNTTFAKDGRQGDKTRAKDGMKVGRVSMTF